MKCFNDLQTTTKILCLKSPTSLIGVEAVFKTIPYTYSMR